ncbi:metallophosphoesterase [Bacillus timonensis]|uniref:Metallophosphoesterase n=2 Tax=Bacillus timonensis TaxID=1033734 RepID=A0A4S3PUM0_9BACI|nr:metallophosphoesterase [Bacillus timonensis]
MMSIALISDIHGNMTALETVLEHIKARGIETVLCLGDLVGKGPNSALVVDRIQEVCEVVLLGNWDDFIQNEHPDEGITWHRNQLGDERLSYLGTLPFHYDFYMSGKYIRLYHASAKSVHHRVVPMIHSDDEKRAMFEYSEWISPLENRTPDIIGFGDIHAALIEPMDTEQTLLNVGSVGNPLDTTQATFAILHGKYHSKEVAPFSIEIVRLPYDVEKELTIAANMGLPYFDKYAAELREAVYRGAPNREK